MGRESRGTGDARGSFETIVEELMTELGRAFDLSARIGRHSLGEAVEKRLLSLELGGRPDWGTEGSLMQLSKEESGALDFYYRPHLFPDMAPALRLGHRLQFDLLPRLLPEKSPLRVAAVLESYCHLSGDLLGWRREGDDLLLWIVDVSGHGVRAGLAAATLYFLIGAVEPGLSPAEFAGRVNEDMLAAKNAEDARALFATAIWLRAQPEGRILYASSGHSPMLLRHSSGEVEKLEATGIPLGLLPQQTFGEKSFWLEDGALACLFTDGVVEAKSQRGEELGSERLADLLGGEAQSPLDVTRTIYRAVRDHRGSTLLDDDLTFLVIEAETRDRDPSA